MPLDDSQAKTLTIAQNHFRCQIFRCAADSIGLLQNWQLFGQPKIDQLDMATGIKANVLRFEVTVDDAFLLVQVAGRETLLAGQIEVSTE